ncbi:DUF899 family protein [Micromonospora sp. WMMD737]|uniref:DUF899 family protein n=1 Tax=Micromonospora sp. WMMD737 TaxID=3404113 RepID=UPI003B95A8E8
MTQRRVVSRDEWETAGADLLVKEKELTRARDALSARRRRLPMVRIDKEYAFESPDGPVDLPGLFGGRRQLIVRHYLDLTALGRQEEELEYPQQWWRHHDRCDDRHHGTGHRDRMPARVVGHPTELEQH